jgi:hypothetical protein
MALVVLVAAWAGGCENSNPALPDGGLGRRLEIVAPADGPAGQLGLRYGQTALLGVRYTLDDPDHTPVRGEPVRFAIFGDPAGSTLARDSVNTGDDGLAMVMLSAGGQEGTFTVRTSAAGASDVEFSVSVSMLEFVRITVSFADPLPGAGTRTLTGALYSEQHCTDLPPSAALTGNPRVMQLPTAATASLDFVNLLSRNYAAVARVSAGDRLLAYGCVDIDRHLASPGAMLAVEVPTTPVTPSVVGAFALTSEVGTSRGSRSDDFWSDLNIVDKCDGHAAQLLLDEIAARVSDSRAAQIAALRGAGVVTPFGAAHVTCRPAVVGAETSLDADLDALLAVTPAGAARASVWGDLDALLTSGVLESHLTLAPTLAWPTDGTSAPLRLLANHTAQSVSLRLASASANYDLFALGWPTTTSFGVAADASMSTLHIDHHALPVALPRLWGLALGALSLQPRLPSLAAPTLTAWLAASVGAAQHGGNTGCAAVEDLLCERTGPTGCATTLVDACSAAVDAVGARLAAVFAGTPELFLDGSASVNDDNGDLVADRLSSGQWTVSGAIESRISFTATRAP